MADMELKSVEKIKALIENIENVTGESYENLTGAVQGLVDISKLEDLCILKKAH